MARVNLAGTALLLAVAMGMLSPPALAQRSEGGIAGTVRDPQNAVVKDAKIVVTNLRTGQEVTATTDEIGFFRVLNLQPGPYVVSVQASGFKVALAQDVLVQVGTITSTDIQLELGGLEDQVTVTGTMRLVETEQARLAETLTERQVTELPLNGREVYQLVSLQPGVAATNAPVISNVPSTTSSATFDFGFVANGSTPRGNNFVLDGNTNNNEWLGGTPLIFPSVDAIEEVQVQTLNFSAEFGRNNGAVVNVVTKAGGNQVDGTAFWAFRHDAMNARNFFDRFEKSPLRHNQFGAGVGFPLQRDRTFLFLNFEGSRRKDGAPELATTETPAFRDLVFRTRPDSLAARFFRDFPGPTCVPGTERDTGSIPHPAFGPLVVGARDGVADICDTVPSQVQTHDSNQYLARVDHNFSAADRLFVRWIATHASPDVSRQQLLNANMRGFEAPLEGFFGDLAVDYKHLFNDNVMNTLRLAFARNDSSIAFNVPQSESRSLLDAARTPDFFPHLSFDDGVIPFGGGVYVPRSFEFNTFTLANTLIHSIGRHAVKYGFELRHIREKSDYQLETRPFYEFNSIFNFANDQPWLLDALVNRDPASPDFGGFAATPRQFRWTQWSAFIQDDWKVTSGLTLNVGLRYEVFGDPSEAEGRLNNITLGSGSTIAERIATANVGRTDRMFAVDRNNFAPRLGIAWDPVGDGRTAVRGGFSVAYLEPYSNLFTNSSRLNPPDATFLTLFPALGVGTAINYQFPVVPSPDFASPVTANGGALVANIGPSGVLPDLKSAYSLQWFGGIERELGGDFAFAVNYVGTRGEKLYVRDDLNRVTGDICGPSACDFTENRLAPGWGQTFIVSNGNSSEYHGMNAQLRKRHSRGYQLSINYTLGKVTDEVSDPGLADFFNVGTPLYTGTMDVDDPALDEGPSDFDVRHRFSATMLWDLPQPGTDRPMLRALLGGWQVNTVVSLQSGRPFNVFCTLFWFQGCDWNMDATRNDRPNMPSGIQTEGFSRDDFVNGVFAVSDFCPDGLTPFYLGTPCVPPGTNGNLPRNAFRGPGYASVDLAVFKNLALKEGVRAQIRIEVFNLFNRVNLYQPVGSLGSPNFGRSLAAFPARQIQVGAKVLF